MPWFFYWQKTPESAWELADSRMRQIIIEERSPPFVTVLDLDNEVMDDMAREDLDKIHYRGDLYFDFDSDSIEEVIPQFQKFLSKLVEMGVDLRQVELYASGGKGFHIIIPQKIFILSPSTAGYTFLPHVYKEMAAELYVDTLDMRVYSARKGRMFRVANVRRTNGRYKVQLSVGEARGITPELYEQYTAEPRQGITIDAPVMNSELALSFTKARDKVKKAITARRAHKADERLMATFNNDFPATVKMIGLGENVKEGVGFQRIATQIAITAHALGQSEARMLEVCEGLIASHASDGSRYNTPQKRRKELLRMYHYMQDNPCYEFSVGGLKSLLTQGTPTPDLQNPIDDQYNALADDEELELSDSISKGVRFNQDGIYTKIWDKEAKDYFVIRVSELGIANVALLRELGTGNTIGYEYDAYVNGVLRGRRRIAMNAFTSANSLQVALGGIESTAIQVNDAQAKGMMDIMRKHAQRSKKESVVVPREGLDIVQLLDTPENEDKYEIIYASANAVLSPLGNEYRLSPTYGDSGALRSDLLHAPILTNTPETQQFFDLFFKIHPRDITARTLGYYFACFLCQLLRKEFHQFPILQVYGQSGAGKTSYNQLVSNLHFYKKLPPVWAANDVTPFTLQALLQSSASLPVIFDEFKPNELGAKRATEFLMVVRNNYTGNSGGKGRVTRDAGPSNLIIAASTNAAPLIFLTENKEDQTAVVDRSVEVAMANRQEGKSDDAPYFHSLKHRKTLGMFGHLLAQAVLTTDIDALHEDVMAYRRALQSHITRPATARPVYNNAAILAGLDLGQGVLKSVFGERYTGYFESWKDEIITNIDKSLPLNQSEGTKVLTTLASMSSRNDTDPYRLIIGVDYNPAIDGSTKEPCVDIHLRNAWDKYSRHKRSQGEQLLYTSEAAFINGLSRHPGVVDTVCPGSPLKDGKPSVKVVRFNLRMLYNVEHVEEFRNLEKENLFTK